VTEDDFVEEPVPLRGYNKQYPQGAAKKFR